MDEDKAIAGKRKPSPKKLSEHYLRHAAPYYLKRHPASESHFAAVMARKIDRSARAHDDPDTGKWKALVTETLIPEMRAAGFLNDALYEKALLDSLSRRGLPKKAIAQKLKMKGLSVSRDTLAENDDNEAARIFVRRKRLKTDTPEARKKALGTMARAGFSYDAACRALDMRAGAEEDDGF